MLACALAVAASQVSYTDRWASGARRGMASSHGNSRHWY
jgi:hypothetical protein